MMRRAALSRGTATLRRTPMKRKTPKRRPGHDKAMLDACRGQPCYLAIPGVCRGDIATVVPCHANSSRYGKGMGIKAHDKFTVPGCMHCHQWLDQGPADRHVKAAHWDWAYNRWSAVRDAQQPSSTEAA